MDLAETLGDARRNGGERKPKQKPIDYASHRCPSGPSDRVAAFRLWLILIRSVSFRKIVKKSTPRLGDRAGPYAKVAAGRKDGLISGDCPMSRTLALALALTFVAAPTLAFAEDACMTQAMDKKLAGAAKTSFMKKCEKDACMAQAKDKNLHGAAETSFVKKCMKDAMAM